MQVANGGFRPNQPVTCVAASWAGSTFGSSKARPRNFVGFAISGKAWSGRPGIFTSFSVDVGRPAKNVVTPWTSSPSSRAREQPSDQTRLVSCSAPLPPSRRKPWSGAVSADGGFSPAVRNPPPPDPACDHERARPSQPEGQRSHSTLPRSPSSALAWPWMPRPGGGIAVHRAACHAVGEKTDLKLIEST